MAVFAKYFWSADDDQITFIEKLKPGTALLTEIEKDDVLEKEGAIKKAIWDYSIDLIGPTDRAKRQVAACKAAGVGCYLKSEPELAFEAPGLPYIPCMDRWYDRAEALAASGANGAWVLAWFRPNQGTTSRKYTSMPGGTRRLTVKPFLQDSRNASRVPKGAAPLRRAWGHVSEAISWSPELPPYFLGPYYLGPVHPMVADPDGEIPACFRAKSEFANHFLTEPRGDLEVFGRYYRNMERALSDAVKEMDYAATHVPQRCRAVFDAEDLPTRWFYHTARTHANFYESCMLRNALMAFPDSNSKTPQETVEAQKKYERWRAVLEDERENTKAALSIVEKDSRLDLHTTRDGAALEAAEDLMRQKLALLEQEIKAFLPSIAEKSGFGY